MRHSTVHGPVARASRGGQGALGCCSARGGCSHHCLMLPPHQTPKIFLGVWEEEKIFLFHFEVSCPDLHYWPGLTLCSVEWDRRSLRATAKRKISAWRQVGGSCRDQASGCSAWRQMTRALRRAPPLPATCPLEAAAASSILVTPAPPAACAKELDDLAADTRWNSAKISLVGCLQHCPIPWATKPSSDIVKHFAAPGMTGTEQEQHATADPEEPLGCTQKLPGAAVIQHSERAAEQSNTRQEMEELNCNRHFMEGCFCRCAELTLGVFQNLLI